MKKELKLWWVFVSVFVIPTSLYFVVNLYWWLFGNNYPSMDKMLISSTIALLAGFLAVIWADLEDLFE